VLRTPFPATPNGSVNVTAVRQQLFKDHICGPDQPIHAGAQNVSFVKKAAAIAVTEHHHGPIALANMKRG
jgi:hypothetical protein